MGSVALFHRRRPEGCKACQPIDTCRLAQKQAS